MNKNSGFSMMVMFFLVVVGFSGCWVDGVSRDLGSTLSASGGRIVCDENIQKMMETICSDTKAAIVSFGKKFSRERMSQAYADLETLRSFACRTDSCSSGKMLLRACKENSRVRRTAYYDNKKELAAVFWSSLKRYKFCDEVCEREVVFLSEKFRCACGVVKALKQRFQTELQRSSRSFKLVFYSMERQSCDFVLDSGESCGDLWFSERQLSEACSSYKESNRPRDGTEEIPQFFNGLGQAICACSAQE